MNVSSYLLENTDDRKVALLTHNAQFSYGELKALIGKQAWRLREAGVGPGDRVGLLGANSPFWVAAYLGIMNLGAVAVPLPTITTVDELKKKIHLAQLHSTLLDTRSYRKVPAAFESERLLFMEDDQATPGSQDRDDFAMDQPGDIEAALMLTSGTTAQPRAVRITHRNIQANTASIVQYLELDAAERILVILPFYYCFGTSLLHSHLRAGGSLVLCNTFAYPETALDMLERYACTGIAGVPSTYQTLLRNTTFPQRRFPSLKKVQQAGGKLQEVLIQELVTALPEARIYIMYGQTEATARLSYLPPEMLVSKMGSIGRGIPGVELGVLDETGQPVKPREVGEIVARGENISPGYWNDPEATAEKFAGGVLHTGDLATVDEEGFIYIVDRKSDFIKSLGHRISSQEIEASILEIPEIVSAVAVGEPDLSVGEAIKVFVTLKQGSELTTESILAYCRARLARHMQPKEVVILDQLPTNAHGKVIKSMLRAAS
jgi:acyl-CoA synthetase (AMP-forming)/AMP-acid ligase II